MTDLYIFNASTRNSQITMQPGRARTVAISTGQSIILRPAGLAPRDCRLARAAVREQAAEHVDRLDCYGIRYEPSKHATKSERRHWLRA